MTLTIAILAGGQSRRMGTDKAALEIGGRTLLEHAARRALAVNLPVLVIGHACPHGWPLPEVQFLADEELDLGPIGGLATALRQTQTSVLALACDLPLLTADAVQWLCGQNGHSGEHGLIVVNGSQWEPLFSIYRAECLPLVEARLAEGRRSLQGLIQAGNFALADAPEWVAGQLANVNTPEEWQEKVRRA